MRSSRPTRSAFFDRGPGYATLSGGRPNSDLDCSTDRARLTPCREHEGRRGILADRTRPPEEDIRA
jgi:hypothetical protein